MQARTARWIAWFLLGLQLLLTAVGLVLVVLNRRTELPPFVSSVVSDAALLVAFVPFGVVGAMIFSRRPGNRIGLIFLFTGLTMALGLTAFEYLIYGDLTNPGSLPGLDAAFRVSQWLAVIPFLAYMFLFLLFPDGHLPSRRWLPVAGLAVVAGGWQEGSAISDSIPFEPARWLAIVAMALCALAPLVRYRRASSDERQQIKWFAVAAVPAVAFLMPNLFTNPSGWYFVLFVVAQAAVPFAAGIAIFKYRLYDIDVFINKAVVYGSLAAFITIVYVVVVVGIGAFVGATEGLSLVATAIVAVAFQPAHRRVQGFANRLVYGERATPYEVLAEFSRRMGETYAPEEVLPQMARVMGEGTGAAGAAVWVRSGTELHPAATWPESDGFVGRPEALADGELPRFPSVSAAVPVRDLGELLGALTVTKPPSDPLRPTERKLLDDLASQAGLLLRNVALISDLRASRKRLVAAQDDERRRLERDLHDGAQQQFVALSIQLGLAESLARRDPERTAQMLAGLQTQAGEALDQLRDLAHGIYPPLLADQGLVVALEAQARKAAVPTRVEANGLGRYSKEVEAAAYFCCLESLQNVAKYAQATGAVVKLEEADGFLAFSVTDDGVGFRVAITSRGAGTTNMADRLEALGGVLDVRSSPGRGTAVYGRIPIEVDS